MEDDLDLGSKLMSMLAEIRAVALECGLACDQRQWLQVCMMLDVEAQPTLLLVLMMWLGTMLDGFRSS